MDSDFYFGYYMLACVYATLNREDDARRAVKNVIRLNPKFSLREEEQSSTFKNPADLKKFIDCLRKSGLPE
jgi:hypothetical protein